MISPRLVALSLLAALLAFGPMAHASPPDQSWIPGIYDNADFDDVVLLITGKVGVVPPNLVWLLRPLAPVDKVTSIETKARPTFDVSVVLSRAPPLA